MIKFLVFLRGNIVLNLLVHNDLEYLGDSITQQNHKMTIIFHFEFRSINYSNIP